MRLLILVGALIAFLSAFRPARADECDAAPAPTGRALDVEFDAAVEGIVVSWERGAGSSEWRAGSGERGAKNNRSVLPTPHSPLPTLQSLIERLDSDRYAERAKAGAELAAIVAGDPSAARWLFRARATEYRPEVRYWLNRTLRAAYRCDTCDGRGYCAVYVAPGPSDPFTGGQPCRRCGRNEWQHGAQWLAEGVYGPMACAACGGSGTYWNHCAVD